MKLTNRLGLPAPLVKAISRPRPQYGPKTVSITTLIRPAQITGLEHQHEDNISEDAADRLWALMGTLLHDVLEGHAQGLENTIAEQRLEMLLAGWTITGKYDLTEFILDNEDLSDWKFTSIYALKEKEPVKSEWEAQLNGYAELLRQQGRTVTSAKIVAIGRDWSKRRAARESDYPQKAVLIKPVELWPSERVLGYFTKRVRLYEAALKGEWPECSPDERWARPSQFAIMKKGNKKATKLCDDEAQANRWIDNNIADGHAHHYRVEPRPGESIRCESYCSVSQFCPQWAKLKPTLSKQLEDSITIASEQKTGTDSLLT
jgi:hypothetical protein